MLPTAKFYDVWLIKSNQVIREIPAITIEDWLVERRIISQDKIRPSGTADWYDVGKHPSYPINYGNAELPQSAIFDLPKYSKRNSSDDDVDMIPLIDVSLVLLVYFLMNTSSIGSGSSTKLPVAEFASVQGVKDQAWIEIENSNSFVLGFAERNKKESLKIDSQDKIVSSLRNEINNGHKFKELTIYAPGDSSAGTVRKIVTILDNSFNKDEINKIHLGVTGKK
jgi:biopolymer transport protein ExbD